MSSVAGITDAKEYARLLGNALPHVIHTEEENRRCLDLVEKLLHKDSLTHEEERLLELLTLLIEQFEAKAYPLPQVGPVDIVRHLMEANDLRQSDMLDVFGAASVASEVLGGKRELSKTHISRLSKKFHVSPALFFNAD